MDKSLYENRMWHNERKAANQMHHILLVLAYEAF